MANQIKTGEVRFSYVSVFQKRVNDDGTEGKYETSIIVSKDDKETIAAVRAELERVYSENKDKFNGKTLKNLEKCWHDGDEEKPNDEAYANSYYFTAKSTRRISVIDRKQQALIDDEEFYSGCYGKAIIHLYPYFVGKTGIAAGLDAILKTKDGDRLGGSSVNASTAFAEDFEEGAAPSDGAESKEEW